VPATASRQDREASAAPAVAHPLVVLDDDPTGAQTLAGVRVLLAWEPGRIRRALAGRRCAHLLTNHRALVAERAYEVVRGAAAAALEALPSARLALRGDSTLRGHLLEEYLALRDAALPGRQPPILLVPALPSAGRVTVGGVHYYDRDGVRTPLHETEYARDGVFAYSDARLLAWAEERSQGLLRREDGREIHLTELRARGPEAVADALVELSALGRPAACAPDAETVEDVGVVARGLELALERGARVVVRCAPTFVGVAAGTAAPGLAEPPAAPAGAVVVCGSYVPATTRQLIRLLEARPGTLVEVDVLALASDDPGPEVARAAAAASELLVRRRLAVVATPRVRPPGTDNLAAGEQIAVNLARVLRAVEPRPSVVVAKGGITSAVTLREGLGALEAEVLGPILPGVSLWQAGDVAYVVFPGNVGGDTTLAETVRLILEAPC
jgi:uncharacterized protein YgbK (DUF1537 family)